MTEREKILPPAVARRIERAFVAALPGLSQSAAALAAHDQLLAAGLSCIRTIASAANTLDPIGNPYWRLITELPAVVPSVDGAQLLKAMRPALVTAFSYAVPTDAVLDRIVAAGDIIEIGAGGGYWARCLSERGADVVAFDRILPVEQVRPGGRLVQHHPVGIGGPAEALAAAPDARTLLLCWPPGLINRDEADAGAAPIFSPMGMEALDRFRGDTLVFIGDRSRSFGSPQFFERLDAEWSLTEQLVVPNLGSWRDGAYFFRRRAFPLLKSP